MRTRCADGRVAGFCTITPRGEILVRLAAGWGAFAQRALCDILCFGAGTCLRRKGVCPTLHGVMQERKG